MEKFIGNAEIELCLDSNEAFASAVTNPSFMWGKLVVTDSLPNGNGHRIPAEEFANIIKTGKYTPIKMPDNGPAGHLEAKGKPIGVFTDFNMVGDKLHALVAFWLREREDLAELKSQAEEGKLPQVSWEIYYDPDLSEKDENGVTNLRGVSFNGAVIVANPAYAGRTPIYAFASKNEDDKMELEEKIAQLEQALAEKEVELSVKDAAIAEKEAALATLESELSELRTFKQSIEAEAEKLVKLDSIKAKFAEHNITKPDEYFDSEDNQAMLLGLSDAALSFMLQEMVAFASVSASLDKNPGDVQVPLFPDGEQANLRNPKKLASAYKNLKQK